MIIIRKSLGPFWPSTTTFHFHCNDISKHNNHCTKICTSENIYKVADASATLESSISYDFDRQMEAKMTLNDAVAKRLLELCEERDYSLNQFATISGISHSTLKSIVDGQSQAPKITTIK